jgi:hypothetical protein
VSTVHLEVPEGVFSRILERVAAAKRDIDMVAGPNPIEPRLARAKENIGIAAKLLNEVQIVPDTEADPGPQGFYADQEGHVCGDRSEP